MYVGDRVVPGVGFDVGVAVGSFVGRQDGEDVGVVGRAVDGTEDGENVGEEVGAKSQFIFALAEVVFPM